MEIREMYGYSRIFQDHFSIPDFSRIDTLRNQRPVHINKQKNKLLQISEILCIFRLKQCTKTTV